VKVELESTPRVVLRKREASCDGYTVHPSSHADLKHGESSDRWDYIFDSEQLRKGLTIRGTLEVLRGKRAY